MKQHTTAAMELWFKNLPGLMILDYERKWLTKHLGCLPYAYIVQLGGVIDIGLRSYQGHHVGVYFSDVKSSYKDVFSICGDFTDLPFLPNSVDLFIMPHILEFVAEPQLLIQEACEALALDGRLIIMCFNSFSLWEIYHLFADKKIPPWMGSFYSAGQLKKWLLECNMTIQSSHSFFYRWPSASARVLQNLLFLEGLGSQLCPGLGAVNIIEVIKPKSHKIYVRSKKYALSKTTDRYEPSTRNIHE